MKSQLALLSVPFALVVLLGAGVAGQDGATAAPGVTSSPSVLVNPPPARRYRGDATGCTVLDPSGTGGCVTPAMAWLMDQVHDGFGELAVGCWDPHLWNPRSDHPQGKACDYTVGTIGTFPGPALVAQGWVLATWLRANKAALHVNYVIFQGRIWSREHNAEGWRRYDGAGGIYDPTDATGGHYDHVHVSTVD